MPEPSLSGAVAKLDRAQEHFATLDAAISGFADEGGYEICDEFSPTEGWNIVRFRLLQPLPLRWGAILGDAIQNTRAALDHVVYQLVILSGNDPTDDKYKRTQWPICESPDEYWRGIKGGKPQRDRFLSGINDEYRAIVDKFQPCNGDVGAFMTTIGEISNRDKHRLLHASHLVPVRVVAFPVPNQGGKWLITYPAQGPDSLRDDPELYRWKVDVPEWPDVNVKVERGLTFTAAFSEPDRLPEAGLSLGYIQTACSLARATVQSFFDPLFPVSAF